MTTRKELTEAIGTRYRAGSRSEKQKILDEFVALTGCHRKHAIRALNGERATDVEKKGRSRFYDEAARQALILLWEAADRVCGKRLKALIPILVDAMERHGHLDLDPIVKDTSGRPFDSVRVVDDPNAPMGATRTCNAGPF